MGFTTRVRRTAVAALLAVGLGTASLAGAGPAAAYTPTSTDAANWVNQIFALINQQRASHHLAALRWSAALNRASTLHNNYMAKYNTLSHQLPGEAALGTRITAQRYYWSACAENVSSTTNWTQAGVIGMETSQYAEGPGGGHYANLMNTRYTDVGLNVLIDTTHRKAWMTIDFAAPL